MSEAPFALRPMRWWDVEAAAALEPMLFPGEEWSPATFWSVLARADHYRAWVVQPDRADPATLAGYGVLSWSGSQAEVQTLAVAPGFQRRGLGRALLAAMVAEAGRHDAEALLLEVRADNVAAQHLYAATGFAQIGVRHGYYSPGVDALVLRLLHPGRESARVR